MMEDLGSRTVETSGRIVFELEEETWCTRSEQPLPTYPPKHAKQNKVRAGGSLKDSRRRTTMAPANGPMAVRHLSRLPASSLVKRGSNTKLLVHASVSSLATEPFATPTLPWDVCSGTMPFGTASGLMKEKRMRRRIQVQKKHCLLYTSPSPRD